MFPKELDAIKRYLYFYLVRKFIEVSLVSYSWRVFFMKKLGRRIRFCVNYKRLNAIIKKDRYPIPLIEKTLA